jgi:hypothetical protein
MIARITVFAGAWLLGSVLAGCAQSPRSPVSSTVPPANKPLAVDPALLGPKAAATERNLGPADAAKDPERLSEGR